MSDPSFVAFDVETANTSRGSICAIGLSVVRDGRIERTHSWLNRPPASLGGFDPRNIGVHGITSADVRRSPSFPERLDQMMEVVGDLPVVAHNASFDFGALRAACDAEALNWPSIEFYCSLAFARKAIDLDSHRLPLVAAALGIDSFSHHDAGQDAEVCAEITLRIAQESGAPDLDTLGRRLGIESGSLQGRTYKGCKTVAGTSARATTRFRTEPKKAAEPRVPAPGSRTDHALSGQVVVFTGMFLTGRPSAEKKAQALGAIVAGSVTRATTLVVTGSGKSTGGPVTNSAAKAHALRASGQAVEVITEIDYLVLARR